MQTGTHTLRFRASMHTRVRHWQSLPRAWQHFKHALIPSPCEHPRAEGYPGGQPDLSRHEHDAIFSSLAGASPSLQNFGCSASWIPAAQGWLHTSSSGMALGKGSSYAQGGMLPRVGQGDVYAPAWQGARKREQVSKLFRAQLKHIFSGRDICMENSRGKTPSIPSLEKGEWEMIRLSHLRLTQNPPGLTF